ncbi:MAG: acyltransferase domain-containing protein [Firmicutes bacterium]|nr:acyltransferase domain-containing protein [Bacillota bacterium]MCL5012415.1 acyltransferase domain-containing protein [Bacillota bacterium]
MGRLKPVGPRRGIIVFAGQGDTRLDTRLDRHPVFVRALADVSELCGQKIPPPSALGENSSQVERQMALAAYHMSAFDCLKDLGYEPVAAAGISLGEFAAAMVSGALSRVQGYKAVLARARCMQEYAGQGTMMAVLGLRMDVLSVLLRDAAWKVIYVSATYGDRVHLLSGSHDDLGAIRAEVANRGGRTVPVPSGIPSHCILMERVVPCLTSALQNLLWTNPEIPWISGIDGFVTRDAAKIQFRLVRQTVEPVSWPHVHNTLSYLHANVIDGGPGHSVSRMAKSSPGLFVVASSDDIKPW